MTIQKADYEWMALALQLAAKGCYSTRPNPAVGCVIIRDGVLLGQGWHQQAGDAHAEVNAMQSAATSIEQATAYVTLEPCSHQGKTGPCAQALIEAGIARVVYAMEDPNPLVAGRGLDCLREAGIVVDGPLLQTQAEALNKGFIRNMREQRPWVRCKMAISLDGRTAMANGDSQWITSPAARRDVQRLRAQSAAIVTGVDSIIADNSRLNLRAEELDLPLGVDPAFALQRPPIKVVLDSQLRMPLDAAILKAQEGSLTNAATLIATTDAGYCNQEKVSALQELGQHIEVTCLPANASGHVQLTALLALLSQRQYHDVLVEAGAKLSGAFLAENLIDELIVYQAPVILGDAARPMFFHHLESMADKVKLNLIDRRMLADDQRMMFQVDPAAK